MEQIQSRDVPYGTEVFVLVPEWHVPAVRASRARLYDSLSREFPQFRFSLGLSMDQDVDDFFVTAVAGAVGEGVRRTAPFVGLSDAQEGGIVRHLRAFVRGNTGQAN